MWSFFSGSSTRSSETKSNNPPPVVEEADEGFVLVEDKKATEEALKAQEERETREANLIATFEHRGVKVYPDYENTPPPVPTEAVVGQFTEISIKPPTAYSVPLADFKYDPGNPLRNSSHEVFMGLRIATEKDAKLSVEEGPYFIKHIDIPAMAYVEAFQGRLLKESLMYGATGAQLCYDSTLHPKLSSKGISHFKTFKDAHLTDELFENPEFRGRFIRIMGVMFRMMEDDFHQGNLTAPDAENNSPGLQVFDADCSFWPATYKIKGPRPNVDNVPLPLGRDPDVAFNFTEQDILEFPNFVNFNPWYFPSRENPLSALFSDNPWPAEDVEVVQKLTREETQHICFEEFIDWMLDLSTRLPAIAALTIPHDLTVPGTGQNVIELYSEMNSEFDQRYWNILPKVPGFADFVKHNTESILRHILIRASVRNGRFEKEKAEVLNDPAKEKFSHQFDNALMSMPAIVDRFNRLICEINKANIDICNSIMMSSVSDIGMFRTICDGEARKNKDIPCIENEKAIELINEALQIADQMLEKEEKVGVEDWREFEEFDYKHKPSAFAPSLKLIDSGSRKRSFLGF